MGWLERNFQEIEHDRALQLFGMALALANVVTFANWAFGQQLVAILSPAAVPICWPFFDDCHLARGLSADALTGLLWGYLAVSLAGVAAFARPGLARVGCWILVALLVYRGFFLFQDYRLRLNQHYMLYWATLAFLLVPGKRIGLRCLVVLFYFCAGVIKLDPDWISGAALSGKRPLFVPEELIPASCVYVLVLELVLVFGVFSKRAWLFWATLVQLALFHITSWGIVGFYYPLLMFAILSIFPLERYVGPPPAPDSPDPPGIARSRHVAIAALLGGFLLAQLAPHAYPGDSAMTGEGRLFALHMFDAPMKCRAVAVVDEPDGRERRMRLRAPHTPARIRCDPIVYWSVARHLCRTNRATPRFEKMAVHMRSRRAGERDWHRLLHIEDFCGTDPGYRVFGHNEWIDIRSVRPVGDDAAPADP